MQRPGIPEVLALDAHLLRLLGGLMQGFAGARSDLVAVVDEMVKRSYPCYYSQLSKSRTWFLVRTCILRLYQI